MKRTQTRRIETALELVATLLGLVLLNVLADSYFFRLDLTEDQRYTLSAATERALEDLNEGVYVEVYLEGTLNADLKRLQKATREKLEEFRDYAEVPITYRFVDPNELTEEGEQRQRFFQQLTRMGIPPTQVTRQEEGKVMQETVFPGAVIRYGNEEKGVLLLKGNKADTPEQQLNQSIENIEFELISALQQMAQEKKPLIGMVSNIDGLRDQDTYSFRQAMSEAYIIDQIDLEKREPIGYDALILAQPKKRLSQTQRYRLDQYIMRGGKVLFLIDKVQMNLDSIATGGTYAFGYDLNLQDMLFSYGVRINIDLIQDQLLHGFITVNTGNYGNQANLKRLPWLYHIIVNKFAKHPITRNLDAVYMRFASTIDTVRSAGVRKTPLLFTSKYSRIRKCPTMVDINEIKQIGRQPELFNKQHLPVAYLLEGEFSSVYSGRFPPRQFDRNKYRKQSEPTRLLVCSDGDLIRNEFNPRTNQPLPLGYDPATQGMFSNQEFIENALAYLIDPDGIIASRNRVVKMRPLDRTRIQEERRKWQVVNLGLPLVLLALLGGGLIWWRRKRYAK